MKKIIHSTLIAFAMILASSIGLTLYAAPPSQAQSDSVLFIMPIASGVEVLSINEDVWRTVDEPTEFRAGDRIRTNDSGLAILQWFNDGTLTELYANSELYINVIVLNSDGTFRIEVTLLSGMIVNRVEREISTSSRYIINTATMRLEANQSVFGTFVEPNLQSWAVVVNGGIVAFHQQSRVELSLAQGQAVQGPLQNLELVGPLGVEGLPTNLLQRSLTPLTMDGPLGTAEPSDNSGNGPNATEEVSANGPSATAEIGDEDDDDSGQGRGRGRGGDDDDNDDD